MPSACRLERDSSGSCMRSASARRITHSLLPSLSLSLSLLSLARFVVLPIGLLLDLEGQRRCVAVLVGTFLASSLRGL